MAELAGGSIPGTAGEAASHGFEEESESWRTLSFLVDESLIMVVCVFTIIAAAERAMPALRQKEDVEKSGDKDGAPHDGSMFPTFQLDASLVFIIPVMLSVTLLALFFFFAQLEFIMAVYIACVAVCSLVFNIQPLCEGAVKLLCAVKTIRIDIPVVGEVTIATLFAVVISAAIVLAWLVTASWILLDVLGISLTIWMLCHIKLPSLRVAAIIFCGLVLYDIFWVFYSERIFKKNVMVDIAMKEAHNPVGVIAGKIGFPEVAKSSPKISLPGKLIFHGVFSSGTSVLGLGDIFVPGLVACYTKRFDYALRVSGRDLLRRHRWLTYFNCSLLGFCVGMTMSTLAVLLYGVAQPALLYIVPTSIVPLLLLALCNGEVGALWRGDCGTPHVPLVFSA